ncbi:glutathione S-transferase omega-1-like [Oscarella lobularis]|uniref:glutathione S-transferase omega-1-like n=1 Tax=Oscarella lobularis TaxID=121494 RepID=UPI003313DED9
MTDENPLRGDPPPLPKGVSLRLYSMEYCPFAERVRIALNLKGIQYDVINCHLYKKPKFLLEANPVAAAVPVLLHEDLTIYESLICIDYIDAAFPDGKKLFPSNPGEKAKAQLLVANFSNQVIPLYYKDLFQRTEELRTKLLDAVHVHVESELKN